MASWQRTHTCGELREAHLGQTVVLNGWVNTYRAYNDQLFIDLRDRYGITQVVFEADHPTLFKLASQEIRNEWVLSVRGKVRERVCRASTTRSSRPAMSKSWPTSVQVLNRCPTPPFEVMSVPQEGRTFGDPELAERRPAAAIPLPRPAPADAAKHAGDAPSHLNKVIRDHLDKEGFL